MIRAQVVLTVLAFLALCGTAAAGPRQVPPVSRAQAEHDVLRFLARGWRHHRLPTLVDSRTHLLRTNTQAVCRSVRGHSRTGRFVCVVRPARHRPHEGLYVSYRRLAPHGFRIHWLFYRRG